MLVVIRQYLNAFKDWFWSKVICLTKNPKPVFVTLTLLAVLVWGAVLSWPDSSFHIYFLNVGQGDSTLIRTPSDYQILVDGGPDQSVLDSLGRIMPFHDRDLDLVILTHPHADHVNGLREVIERYQVETVVYNPATYDSLEYRGFVKLIEERGVKQETLVKGDVIRLDDGVVLECHWPPGVVLGKGSHDVNQDSIVLEVRYNEFTSLLMADAEFGEISELDKRPWSAVELLKVPHQGSAGALSQQSLTLLKPQLAVVSVGKNSYGHPSVNELKKLQAAGSALWRTDLRGGLEVVTNGKRWYYQPID